MKVFALALLAFAISANASSISCGPSKTDCKEPEPVELCTYQKTCKNVCHDVVSFITDFKMKKRCHKECVQRTREVPCTIQKEKCEDVCVTKYKTVTKYRYVKMETNSIIFCTCLTLFFCKFLGMTRNVRNSAFQKPAKSLS